MTLHSLCATEVVLPWLCVGLESPHALWRLCLIVLKPKAGCLQGCS
ncbi:MAG: hypothetical protein KFF72_20275 [Arthrospira sp. SH-MAG29]|nr:hypothetical protein [Arthrospira sp. SH-MAG29]MBS0018653.1 hypothetical protein [Arthrospira sp. SH-MAG29]